MTDTQPTKRSRRNRGLAGAVGLLLAGAIGGGAVAATVSASAADSSSSTASSQPATGPAAGGDTATSVRRGETAQTGTTLATLKAAALKAVPGGTVYRVATDADGATYEAHMTKADGTLVTVKFDKAFKVTEVQDGMGAGGHGGGAPAAPSGAGV